MFFRSKKVIGLDIGSNSIKVAEVDVHKKGATLVNFALTPTPPNSMSAGEIIDSGSVSSAVRLLIDELSTKRKYISVGLSGMAVIVKKITMPKMDPKLLSDQIRYEAEQYIPFEMSNVSLAHHILKHASSSDTVEVLLVAAQNEAVANYKMTVEGARLDCKVMDVSGFALANCFEINYPGMSGQLVGLLNIGASQTQFVVLAQGEVIFSRDISVGGALYTNEISKNLGMNTQEAELLKLSAVAKQEVPEEVPVIIQNTNEMIAEEIKNSVDFLSATTNGLSLNTFYITGGAAVTTGLADTISRVCSTSIEKFNPFQSISYDSKRFSMDDVMRLSPFVAVAIGLGLRQVGDE